MDPSVRPPRGKETCLPVVRKEAEPGTCGHELPLHGPLCCLHLGSEKPVTEIGNPARKPYRWEIRRLNFFHVFLIVWRV